MSGSVLVTGASGNIGSSLAPLFASKTDLQVRALVRSTGRATTLADCGVETVVGSFEDSDALLAAMEHIDSVILIAPPGPDCISHNEAVIAAAARSGVRKIVRISAIKAAEDGRTENTRLHGICDRMLQESGLTFTILRPNYFMQNFLLSLNTIKSDNVFYAGMGDGRLAMIDVRDVAACALAALAEEFDNKVLEISGPESISFAEAAEAVSRDAGYDVSYVPISPADVKSAMLQIGLDEWMADLLREYSEAYSENWGDLVTGNVEKLTGQPPRSFSDFSREILATALR